MKLQIKNEIQTLVEKITKEQYNATDIKTLLILLREYLPEKSGLKDIADLVAHQSRDTGHICNKIRYSELYLKFLEEYITPKKELDVLNLPKYVYEYLFMQFNYLDEQESVRKFKYSIQSIKSKITNYYDKKTYKANKNSTELNKIIISLLSTFRNNYLFNQINLFNDLKLELNRYRIIFDNTLFKNQLNNISMCFLIILNDSEYNIKSKHGIVDCRCYIKSILDRETKHFYLNVNIDMKYQKILGKDDITLSLPILETNLEPSIYCDKSLEIIATSGINNSSQHLDYMLNQPLKLNTNFIIEPIENLQKYDTTTHRNLIYVDSKYGKDPK